MIPRAPRAVAARTDRAGAGRPSRRGRSAAPPRSPAHVGRGARPAATRDLQGEARRHALLDRAAVRHDGRQDRRPGTGSPATTSPPATQLKIVTAQPQLSASTSAARLPRSRRLAAIAVAAHLCTSRDPRMSSTTFAVRRRFASRSRHARVRADGGGLRRRGLPGPRRSRRVVRLADVHDGRPAGRQRAREPRPRAQRDPQLRLRVPAAPRHRQPGAGRRAQGRLVVRPADRARRSSRRPGVVDAARRSPTCVLARRAVARRRDPAGARRAADRRRGAARRLSRPPAAGCATPREAAVVDGPASCMPVRSLPDAVARAERSGGVPRAASRRRRPPPHAGDAARRISPTCAASRWRAARSRSPRPAATTCCWSARPAPARR